MAEAVSIRSVGIEPEVDPGTTEYSAATGGSGRCALTSALLNYTLRRIQNAKLSLEPYPHLYVNHVFEPSFYKECILVRGAKGCIVQDSGFYACLVWRRMRPAGMVEMRVEIW